MRGPEVHEPLFPLANQGPEAHLKSNLTHHRLRLALVRQVFGLGGRDLLFNGDSG